MPDLYLLATKDLVMNTSTDNIATSAGQITHPEQFIRELGMQIWFGKNCSSVTFSVMRNAKDFANLLSELGYMHNIGFYGSSIVIKWWL